MRAKDGLLVRLRPSGGRLIAQTAAAIAGLAARHGNGILELSSRANLQMRGIRESAWPMLVRALDDLGLIDGTADVEAVRNLLVSPLAGLHDGPDVTPIVADLEALFRDERSLHALPPKLLWLLDDGSAPSLSNVSADFRFDRCDDAVSIGVGGTRASAMRLGHCPIDGIPAAARALAQSALRLFDAHPGERRLTGLVRHLGAPALAEALGGRVHPPLADVAQADMASSVVTGPARYEGLSCVGATAPLGVLTAAMLRDIAACASGELRLTPWRTILLPGVEGTPDRLRRLAALGFIVDGADPRLHVSACAGRSGCAQATTDTRADAAALAPFAAPGRAIHVSGCAKGCARSVAAAVTLVGREGRYDLVRDGRARDAPALRDLDLDGVRVALGDA